MTGQVTELNIVNKGLEGKFHSNSSLFKLPNLKSLICLIPLEISYLSKLYVLSIQSDIRFGHHNFELLLKNLTQLREIDLSFVNIFSTIPLNFSSYLSTLWLQCTQLRGVLPESVVHLSNLKSLDLTDNPHLTVRLYTKPILNLSNIEELNLDDNHLKGPISDFFRFGKFRCIPKGKQFDTFENSSYQGNDGLHGFPLSKDCGGDDGVPQTTTPVELDQEEGEDSPMINLQAVLMGYDCGLVIGLSIIYIMLSNQYPTWFSRMDVRIGTQNC
ncbi:hypothetical protein KY290_008021 [Solanum tuberosum]|uniref:Uncharacterized protein n=1 Tax=Solanum tuberosum TaxID=4113 RepID=A0ABQ7W9C1_SOLTU|nr:hypothetical protein KY290_008021 [Solanum tuberosum]